MCQLSLTTSEVSKNQRMMFIAIKTEDGIIKGKLSFYFRMLHVSQQGFYKYLSAKDCPWKYQDLSDAMKAIKEEDTCNDTYGRVRMYQALQLKQPDGISIPSERTVYRIMDQIGLTHRPKRKPNGITKADRQARKSDDLLKRDFRSDEPLKKCVTDITEIKAKDGKLYVSAIFDCFDSGVLGLAMEDNMKATLCEHTLDNAMLAYPDLRGAIIHSDRGTYSNPINYCTYSHERNQPMQSDWRIVENARLIASGSCAALRIFCFLRLALSFDRIFSIGFRSGLYGGRYRYRMPALSNSSFTIFA